MDKISKAIHKLNPKEREQIKAILVKLSQGQLKDLDTKKLKGRDDIYRVRKGSLRIIYRVHNGQIDILAIQRRSDTTYGF
mgnify:CR=1 FL=1